MGKRMRFNGPRYINLNDFNNWVEFKFKVVMSSDNIIIKNIMRPNLYYNGSSQKFKILMNDWSND